jgi:hypothetical protein
MPPPPFVMMMMAMMMMMMMMTEVVIVVITILFEDLLLRSLGKNRRQSIARALAAASRNEKEANQVVAWTRSHAAHNEEMDNCNNDYTTSCRALNQADQLEEVRRSR